MNMALKVIAVLIIVLALVIGIVPQFTNCQYAKSMATPASTATTMATPTMGTPTTMAGQSITPTTAAKAAATSKPRCFYTARGEIAVAVPLLIIGIFMLVSSRKETWRALSVLGIIEGLFAILLPAVLIGVCMKSTMICRQEMEPTLYAAGGVALAASIAALIINELRGRAAQHTELTD
jgi:hypothetical protein